MRTRARTTSLAIVAAAAPWLVAGTACDAHAPRSAAPPRQVVAPGAVASVAAAASPTDHGNASDGRDAAMLANRDVSWTFYPPSGYGDSWCPHIPLPSLFEDAIAPADCGGARPGCEAIGRRGMQIAFRCSSGFGNTSDRDSRLRISDDGGRTVSREHAVGFVTDVFFTERSLFLDFCTDGDCPTRILVLDRGGVVTEVVAPPTRLPAALWPRPDGALRGLFPQLGAFDDSSAARVTLMEGGPGRAWSVLDEHVVNRRGHCFTEFPTVDGADRPRLQSACERGDSPGRHYMTYAPDGRLVSDHVLPPGQVGAWGPRVVILPSVPESPQFPDVARGQLWESSDSGRTFHVVCAPELTELAGDPLLLVECGPRGCAFLTKPSSIRGARVVATRLGWPALEALPRVDEKVLSPDASVSGAPIVRCSR